MVGKNSTKRINQKEGFSIPAASNKIIARCRDLVAQRSDILSDQLALPFLDLTGNHDGLDIGAFHQRHNSPRSIVERGKR